MKLSKTRETRRRFAWAYSSEDDRADTLAVSSGNECLTCHAPDQTHQRWSTEVQVGGPFLGASIGITARDSAKATLAVSIGAGIGAQLAITERALAGKAEMPTIVIEPTKTDSTRSQ